MSNDDESHPFNARYPIPSSTRVLIVGTAPPERFSRVVSPGGGPLGDVHFYYGSADNELWLKILPAITGFQFEGLTPDIKRRKMINFLVVHRIWMHDIFEKYARIRLGSALDSNLRLLEPSNFKAVLSEHRTIEHIIFTGGRAERETCRYMARERIIKVSGISGRMPRSRALELRGRSIRLHAVPSPSAMTRRSGMTSEQKISMYRQVLNEACPDLTAEIAL
ncbi:G:T/U-mismatch repair DNA glycosylase [Bradyrhizobium embrapense]